MLNNKFIRILEKIVTPSPYDINANCVFRISIIVAILAIIVLK